MCVKALIVGSILTQMLSRQKSSPKHVGGNQFAGFQHLTLSKRSYNTKEEEKGDLCRNYKKPEKTENTEKEQVSSSYLCKIRSGIKKVFLDR